MNYAMVDGQNVVFNIANWNGETQWNPGCRIFLIKENEACEIGFLLVENELGYSFINPVPEDKPEEIIQEDQPTEATQEDQPTEATQEDQPSEQL